MSKKLNLHLKVWRQAGSESKGQFETYDLEGISVEMSFLEMLDILNEDLLHDGKTPVEFDSDCREGICGTCGMVINGTAHGPMLATTVCQLHMRSFKDGDTIVVEPWRAKGFPIVKDLVVDRTSFDRIIAAGGFISVKTGCAPESNSILIPKDSADKAMDAASCIGCGACVAACPNASAALFVSAKVAQLAYLPQGQVEAARRVRIMVELMDAEGFGNCSNHAECEAVCPKEISISTIAKMRREYLKACGS
jgi:succinate dehydrogenase / fumarate reductase iron-sulfur subunit